MRRGCGRKARDGSSTWRARPDYACDPRRGKAAMDEVGILPAFRGTSVHDGRPAYEYYRRCRHSLCGAHLLRELTYIEESSPHQRGQWAAPLAGLLLEIKAAVEQARSEGAARLDGGEEEKFRRRYEKGVRRGPKQNRERKRRGGGGKRRRGGRGRVAQTAARKLVARL